MGAVTTGAVVPPWCEGREAAGTGAQPAGVGRRTGPGGYSAPLPWPDDGGLRREPVLDTDANPPRVVRRVGWQRCLRCRRPFFSEDVVRLRLCTGDDGCRGDDERFTAVV